MKTLRLSFFLLLALAAAASAQAGLRPGDTVEIRLSGVPIEDSQQFNAQYTLDDRGMVSLPYIGQVKAGGLPPGAAGNAIENKLKAEKIYTNPTITVIAQIGSRFLNVGGAVRQTGRGSDTPDSTLFNGIHPMGGPHYYANL